MPLLVLFIQFDYFRQRPLKLASGLTERRKRYTLCLVKLTGMQQSQDISQMYVFWFNH